MADSLANLNKLRGAEDGLIRKMVGGGAILLAPIDTEIGDDFAMTDTDGSLKLLEGFRGLGRIAKAGAPNFTPEDTEETVETWGELEPSRSDVTLSKLTVTATLQDTRKETLALAANRTFAEMDAIKAAANGELSFTDNPIPTSIEYRAFYLGVDGVGDDAFFFGRLLPRIKITRGPENWDPTQAVNYPLTVTAFKDNTLGYSSKRFYGGPGAKKRLEAMGFAAASSPKVPPAGDGA